jgi:hypothetical protein
MRKLVRRLLVHYDQFGIIALFGWLVTVIGAIAIPSVLVEQLFLNFTRLNAQLIIFPTMLVVSPILVYACPPFWASILLGTTSLSQTGWAIGT